MIVKPIKTSVFKEGDDLLNFIVRHIKIVHERAIVVVTSKVVALSEGRVAENTDAKAKENLVRQESEVIVLTKHGWITFKDGAVMASAGIDESNANGKLILLPKDSFAAAHSLRNKLCRLYNIKNLGVLITDSRSLPLRAGVIGVATGYAGFCGIRDYRGKPDIFGKKFRFSRTNIADSIAVAAVFLMGEGNEQQPLAVVEDAPVEFCDKIDCKELFIDIREDMYRPLFSKLMDL